MISSFSVLHCAAISMMFGIVGYTVQQYYIYIIYNACFCFFLLLFFQRLSLSVILEVLKKILFLTIIYCGSFYYSCYYDKAYEKAQQQIINSKKLLGYIYKKEELSKDFFEYHIKTTSPCGSYIKLRSKKNVREGSYIICYNPLWFERPPSNIFFEKLKRVCYMYHGSAYSKDIYQVVAGRGIRNIFIIFRQIVTHFQVLFFEGLSHLDEMSQRFLRSIFWGTSYNKVHDNETKYLFQFWGIMHYFARSGLHVMIIANICMMAGGLLGCRFWPLWISSVVFLLFFALISDANIPFYRAIMLWILMGIARYFGVSRGSYVALLAITTIIFLIYNPFWLISPSFQLSFLATFILSIL